MCGLSKIFGREGEYMDIPNASTRISKRHSFNRNVATKGRREPPRKILFLPSPFMRP
jgi:hypothetical protein